MYRRLPLAVLCPILISFVIGCGRETPPEQPSDADAQARTDDAAERWSDPAPLLSDPRDLPEPDPGAELPRLGEHSDEVDRPAQQEDDALAAADREDAALMHEKADILYDRLLSAVVTPDGLVDYELLAERVYRSALDGVTSAYAQLIPRQEREDRIATLINAYNANVLKLVLEAQAQPDFETAMQVSGFFDQYPIAVAGESMTLNELLHDVLRPLGEPRIHAALVSASMSSPPLRNEPYTRGELEEQLDEQSRRWVNDPARNRVSDGVLKLSSVFQWFSQDFEVEPYAGVIGYVRHYADPGSDVARFLREHPDPDVEWLEHDWTLNHAVKQVAPEK